MLQRERERLPLFAGELAAEQETPQERIARLDREFVQYDARRRTLAARQWRIGRRLLASVNEELRAVLISQWNQSSIPADAAYFIDFVRTRLRRLGIVESTFNTPSP